MDSNRHGDGIMNIIFMYTTLRRKSRDVPIINGRISKIQDTRLPIMDFTHILISSVCVYQQGRTVSQSDFHVVYTQIMPNCWRAKDSSPMESNSEYF